MTQPGSITTDDILAVYEATGLRPTNRAHCIPLVCSDEQGEGRWVDDIVYASPVFALISARVGRERALLATESAVAERARLLGVSRQYLEAFSVGLGNDPELQDGYYHHGGYEDGMAVARTLFPNGTVPDDAEVRRVYGESRES